MNFALAITQVADATSLATNLARGAARSAVRSAGPLDGELRATLPKDGEGGSNQTSVGTGKPSASSVDIAHTIGADYNARTGKVTGGHTLINGDVRITQVVSAPDENGVYEAIVEMRTPDGTWQIKTAGASSNPQKNTRFPMECDAQRVEAEVAHAWNNRGPHSDGTKGKWEGKSASGVKLEGYESPRATAYPVHRGKK